MDMPQAFFAQDGNKRLMSRAVQKVKAVFDSKDKHDNKYSFMLRFVGVTLSHMYSAPEEFDRRCLMNIAILGDRFVGEMTNLSLNMDDLEHFFTMCYRFVIEYQLGGVDELPQDLNELLSMVSDFEYSGLVASQIRYAPHQMIIGVVQRYLYHPNLVAIKDLPGVIARSESEREKAESAIEERERRVSALAENLVKYETAFNFVGLYAGFLSMKKTKVAERDWNFRYLIGLGLLLTLPFAAKLYLMFFPASGPSLDFSGIATLVGAELLFIYFFRVALHNFRSIKAQLLQIELRMTLCQFVQSYADYAKSAREGSTGLLDKFEQIVFSGIVNDESAIPSTFDGLEQLAGLVEKMRK